MRKIVFDIETTDAGIGFDPSQMDLAVVAIHDSETDEYSCYTESELGNLWPILERADMLIGYNSNHFDIPLLNKYYAGDLLGIKSLDILEEIKKVLGRRLKLDKIAQGTLGVGKSGHGLEAVNWWKKGEVEKVKNYCIDDVKITKKIYDFALVNKKLKYKEGNEVLTLPIDPSDWENKDESSMTHTMPF